MVISSRHTGHLAGRECNDSIHHLWQSDSPELRVPGEGGDYPGEALDTDRVGAGEQLGVVVPPIVVTEAGAARQEGFIEVLVVDRDSLHEGAAQIHFYLKLYKVR